MSTCGAVNPRQGWVCGLEPNHRGEYDSEVGRHLTVIDGESFDWFEGDGVPHPDKPDYTPRISIEATFPVGVSDEDMAAGRGLSAWITTSGVTQDATITALLLIAEQQISEQIRAAFQQRDTSLVALDEELTESLIGLNARVSSVTWLSALPVGTPDSTGFTLNEGEPHV